MRRATYDEIRAVHTVNLQTLHEDLRQGGGHPAQGQEVRAGLLRAGDAFPGEAVSK